MTSSISNTQSQPIVEPLIHHLMEKTAEVPELTISDLMGEILNLLGQSAIAAHPEAQSLLENRLHQIHYRNGLEPFGKNEQAFYNYSQHLIDKTTGKVSEYCLKFLKTLNLKETIETDQAFDDYHILVNRNKAFEKELQAMREKVEALEQKLSKPSTMTFISYIAFPASNGTHKIPDTIPKHATHFLLYVLEGAGADINFSNTLQHEYSVCYAGMSSQYIWMEICPAREITVKHTQGRGEGLRIFITAYK